MNTASKIRTLALAVVIWALPCAAQLYNLEEDRHWHMTGSVGVNWTKSSDGSVVDNGNAISTYGNIAGDGAMDMTGFVADPKFLVFETGLSFLRGASSAADNSFSSSGIGGGGSLQFLPVSRFPFSFYYRRNAFDSSGSLFGSNSNYTQMGADWIIDTMHVPRIKVGMFRNSNDVRLATSLTDTGYNQTDYYIQAQDTYAGWHWDTGFNAGSVKSNSIGLLNVLSGSESKYRTLTANAGHSLFRDKALLQLTSRDEHFEYSIPPSGTFSNDNLLESVSLTVQHTSKLSSHYSYAFSHVKVSNAITPQSSTDITVLTVPSTDTHSADAGVSYQLTKPVRLFEEFRYYRSTPLESTSETQSSLTESLTGASVQKRLRSFDLSGTYTAHVQLIGTNFENQAHTLSHDVDARAGWGDVKSLHLLGTFHVGRLNFVQQLGGFSHDQRYGLQVETMRFARLHLTLGAERGTLEILNLSGDLNTTYTNFLAQLESRKFTIVANRSLGDGSGALFPADIGQRQFITEPLPIDQLAGTPLLNRTSRVTSASFMYRPKFNLNMTAEWRKENDLLFSSKEDYRIWEVRGRYELGRLTFEAGLGNLRTEVTSFGNPSGLAINRYWVRIRRDFRFF